MLEDTGLRARARLTGGADAPPLARSERLAEVVERARLPETFALGGVVWRAAGLGGFRSEGRLSPVVPALGSYTLLRERGAGADAKPRLYLRVGSRGPFAGVYVRYEPVP